MGRQTRTLPYPLFSNVTLSYCKIMGGPQHANIARSYVAHSNQTSSLFSKTRGKSKFYHIVMYPTYARSITFDMETMVPLWWDEEPYEGEWAECKKGRESEAKVTDQSLANAKSDQATRQAQLDQENAGLTTLTHTNPNGLSDAAESQYGQDLAN